MPEGSAKPESATDTELDVAADESQRDEVDAFIARNREALSESIQRSEADFAAGVRSTRTIRDIVEAGRKRHQS